MTKAIVIRAAGDAALTRQIVRGLETPEMRRLQAETRALRRRDALYWANKRAEAERAYGRAARPRGRAYRAFWGLVGMALEMRREARR